MKSHACFTFHSFLQIIPIQSSESHGAEWNEILFEVLQKINSWSGIDLQIFEYVLQLLKPDDQQRVLGDFLDSLDPYDLKSYLHKNYPMLL
jgi:hypothetical protein